jgi:hypothetical protein
MSCVLLNYDLLLFTVLLPSFYIQGGRVTRKVLISYYNDPDLNSISTCLIYNICTLRDLSASGCMPRASKVFYLVS